MSLVNGVRTVVVDVGNRGLHYGDGLFETIAVRHGLPRHWDLHLRRLQRGCERLGIPAPAADVLAGEARQVSAGHERAVVKLILTRGGIRRGYRAEDSVAADRLWRAYPWPDYPSHHGLDGVAVRICRTPLARQPRLAGLKHLNRLEQVLARAEWQQEYEEGLMLDTEGNVIEGVSSNLFAVKQGVLITPLLDQCGVEGITRDRVMEAAHRLGWSVRVQPLRVDELLASDEIFLTSALIGIWPVKRVDLETPDRSTRAFTVGACTRRLQEQVNRD
ncbi:MAG: aminodeoxychorismate lyase [Candidatus Muproteobacteria bacterium RBG_16_62_13]|uniref:aminodeoxychorismate lyase n=1 Tax=Candidatus Muproteobacteria bacterium RBG_16_62_13 TaxID=1817756 RepID=A0A1F6SYJ7_9PROT|nr:MAG: aminodeoxychorismate lyase [Candidatus Muproteobacteria bacterium RBG_16_62_13]